MLHLFMIGKHGKCHSGKCLCFTGFIGTGCETKHFQGYAIVFNKENFLRVEPLGKENSFTFLALYDGGAALLGAYRGRKRVVRGGQVLLHAGMLCLGRVSRGSYSRNGHGLSKWLPRRRQHATRTIELSVTTEPASAGAIVLLEPYHSSLCFGSS